MGKNKEKEIEVNILSRNNLVPYIEFELKNYGNTEFLYLVDEFPINKKEFPKQPIGTMLIDILNQYEEIIKCIHECKKMIFESEKISDGDYRDSIKEMKHRFSQISNNLEFLSNFINCFFEEIYIDYHVELQNLWNEVLNCKYFDKKTFKLKADITNDPIFEQSKAYYLNLEKEFEYMRSAKAMKHKCIKFFEDLEQEFKDMKETVDKAFIPNKEEKTYEEATNLKFSGISLRIPSATVNFFDEDTIHPKPAKYTYCLNSLTDFFNTSIYHLFEINKQIRICGNPHCHKYFIPSKNQKYCTVNSVYDNDDEQTCRQKEIQYKRDNKNKSEEFLEKLRIRTYNYKNGEEIRKELKEGYKKKKSELMKNSNYSEKDIETELIKWLTIFDKNLQNMTAPKKPRKCVTNKYWIE